MYSTRYARKIGSDTPSDHHRPHPGVPAMAREIGDYTFRRMFPDQNAPQPAPQTSPEQQDTAGEYEYKTVKVPGAKFSRSGHDNALNRWAADGWEVAEMRPRGVLEFGRKDTVTLRRKR